MSKDNKMYKYTYKIVFLAIAVCLLQIVLKIPVNAATIVHSGEVGGLTWSIDSDGKLSVSGKGDYFSEETWTPGWCEYNDEIISAVVDIVGITRTANMFSGCSNMVSVDLSSLDTSNVEDMSFMFTGCSSLTSVDVSGFDISSVSNMGFMFDGCSSLESLDISGFKFNKNNYYSMDTVLYECSGLKTFTVPADLPEDISLPGTSVIYGKDSETYIENSNFYWVDSNGNECTVAAKNLSTSMIYSKIEKTSTDSKDSTEKEEETNQQDVPQQQEGKQQQDAQTINDTNILYSGVDGALTWTIDKTGLLTVTGSGDYKGSIPQWAGKDYRKKITSAIVKVDKITKTTNMFWYCTNMISVDVSGLDTRSVTDMSYMFARCEKLTTIDVSGFNTYGVNDYGGMFGYCKSLAFIDISSFYFKPDSIISSLFLNCDNLISIKMPKVSNVTSFLPKYSQYYWRNTSSGCECEEVIRNSSKSITYTRVKKTAIKKGHKYEDYWGRYKVTNASKRTVEYMGMSSAISANKNDIVYIFETVSIRGKSYKITSIAKKAMRNNTKITGVNIGGNVSVIGDSAFEGCKKLEAIIIGNKVRKIGKKSFYKCKNLDEIYIASTCLNSIGSKAFKKINKKYRLYGAKKSKKFKSKYKKLFKGKIGT